MEKNIFDFVTGDPLAENYLLVTHKDGSIIPVKFTWNEIRLLPEELQRLANGEEVGIRTENCFFTYGHIEAHAVSENGIELFEFVPDFTLQNGYDYFHPTISFKDGTYFQNGIDTYLGIDEILTMMKDGELTRKDSDGTIVHITFDEDFDSDGECRLKAVSLNC